MRFGSRDFLGSLLLSSLVLALLGLGAVLGHRYAGEALRAVIERRVAADTLGKLVAEPDRAAVAAAYFEPDSIVGAMDEISWDVPNILTPFVGSAPWPGNHANARINSLQMRANAELAMPKPPGVYRVFLTGGSTAYGSGASSEERTIGGYLESMLNEAEGDTHFEVWTMADPGWASTQERIAIENRLSELQPDLVISLSGNNDVHWGWYGRDVLWFRTYADEFFWRLANAAFAAAGAATMPDVVAAPETRVPSDEVARRLEKNVALAAFALSRRSVPYVFFLQPTLSLSRKRLSPRERQRRHNAAAVRYFQDCYAAIDRRLHDAAGTNLHYADLSGVFDSLGSDVTVFIDAYHFGDRGNRIVARAIADHLREMVLHTVDGR